MSGELAGPVDAEAAACGEELVDDVGGLGPREEKALGWPGLAPAVTTAPTGAASVTSSVNCVGRVPVRRSTLATTSPKCACRSWRGETLTDTFRGSVEGKRSSHSLTCRHASSRAHSP